MEHCHQCKAMWGTLHNCSPTFHRCNSRFTICSIEWEKTLLCFPSSYPVHTSLLLPIPPTPLTHSPPSSCCSLHPNLANTSHYKRSKPGSFFFFASTKKNFKLPLPTPILLHEVTQQQQQQQHQQRRQLVQHFSLSSFSFSVCFLSTYLLSVTYVPILS